MFNPIDIFFCYLLLLSMFTMDAHYWFSYGYCSTTGSLPHSLSLSLPLSLSLSLPLFLSLMAGALADRTFEKIVAFFFTMQHFFPPEKAILQSRCWRAVEKTARRCRETDLNFMLKSIVKTGVKTCWKNAPSENKTKLFFQRLPWLHWKNVFSFFQRPFLLG